MKFKYIFPLISIFVCKAMLLHAQGAFLAKTAGLVPTISQGLQELPFDSQARKGVLKNGLSYYIRQNKTKLSSANFMLVNKVGSIYEKENQRGLAHFVEHMAFNGTKKYPKNSLIDFLQKRGVRFGADLNAYTGFEETVYHFPLNTQDQDLVSSGLDILREWASEITFDLQEIDQERGVILEEKRATNDLSRRNMAKRLPVITNGSLFGERLPIGTEQVLRNFSRTDIVDFYQTWYRPDRQAIIVVGDVDPLEIEKLIHKKFADLTTKSSNPTPEFEKVNLGRGSQYLLVTDPEITTASVQLTIKNQGRGLQTLDSYRYTLLETLWLYMLRNRFLNFNTNAQAPYQMLSGSYGDLLGGLKGTSLNIVSKDGRFKEAFIDGYTELARIKQFGFTDSEYNLAHQQIESYYQKLSAEADKQQSTYFGDQYKEHFLRGKVAMGILDQQKIGLELLKELTLKDVNELINVWLKEEDRDIIISSAPKDSASMPDKVQLISWIKQIDSQTLRPYQPMELNYKVLDDVQLKSSSVVSKKDIKELQATEYLLSNGIKVVLKPTDFKNNEIIIQAVSSGGTSLATDEQFQVASLVDKIIGMSGIADISPVAFRQMQSTKSIHVMPYLTEYEQGVQLLSGKSDLKLALQLMHLYFTAPRIDAQATEKFIQNQSETTKKRYMVADNIFSDSISALLTHNHIRRQPMHLSTLEKLDTTFVRQFYKERFSNAADFTFIVVGSLKADSIMPLINKYLGSLPSDPKKAKQKFVDPKIKWHKGAMRKDIYAATEHKSTVVLYQGATFKDDPFIELKLAGLQHALQERLMARLREKESGVYSPSARIIISKIPESRYTVQLSFVCAPEQVENLLAATMQELEGLQNTSISQEQLDKFKSERAIQISQAEKTNGYWLAKLKDSYLNNKEFQSVQAQNELLKKLTVNDIQEAANEFISHNKIKQFVLQPQPDLK